MQRSELAKELHDKGEYLAQAKINTSTDFGGRYSDSTTHVDQLGWIEDSSMGFDHNAIVMCSIRVKIPFSSNYIILADTKYPWLYTLLSIATMLSLKSWNTTQLFLSQEEKNVTSFNTVLKSIAKIKGDITSNITSHFARNIIMNELRMVNISGESINLRCGLMLIENSTKVKKET